MTPLSLVTDAYTDEFGESNAWFATATWENQDLCTISRR